VQIIDISMPLGPETPVYPGDPPVEVARVRSLREGGDCNLSRITMSAHAGTHVDAPAHFIDGGAGIDEVPLDALVGEAHVIDLTAARGDIDARTLAAVLPEGAERVLLKTRAAASAGDGGIALLPDGARLLAERRVRLAGIDALSIAAAEATADVHRALLAAGVVILEGLDLAHVGPGAYELLCLPLRLAGCDGAPARAVLVRR
jgi:arylformamidase